MNGYLVPANAKKGTLIFNLFRPFDLILFGSGCAISFIALILFQNAPGLVIILCCLPAAITGMLVVPIPNYHNVLCAIQSIINFYFINRQEYHWKGWCFYERFANEAKSSRKF